MDLNLLVVLDALLEEGSVQGAAARLRLSAPAVSRALTRIRRATGDDILVRTGRTMTPTPHAVALRDRTHELVQQARILLAPARDLDLDTLARVFTIRGHDALTTALVPPLIEAISTTAPHVSLRVIGESAGDSSDLARGQIDLELGSSQPERPEVAFDVIGSDRLVVVLRDGHPLAEEPLTAEAYAAADHVTVSRRGRLHDAIDDALETQGRHRRVVAALPTSTAALQVVARTDCLTVVAERLLGATGTLLGLQTRSLPWAANRSPAVLAWHRRYDSDPAHVWLREQASAVLRSVLHQPACQESMVRTSE